jgi:hypothetical protein
MKQRQGARRAGAGLRMVLVSRDEAGRMAAVRRYEILDTPPDGAFDRVTALAARLPDTLVASATIVDQDRVWFKAVLAWRDERDRPRSGPVRLGAEGDTPSIAERPVRPRSLPVHPSQQMTHEKR